jgi:hypothetical protein
MGGCISKSDTKALTKCNLNYLDYDVRTEHYMSKFYPVKRTVTNVVTVTNVDTQIKKKTLNKYK